MIYKTNDGVHVLLSAVAAVGKRIEEYQNHHHKIYMSGGAVIEIGYGEHGDFIKAWKSSIGDDPKL